MNKGSKTKTDIKDWFIVQRIRILNFIKEHKYISVAIFTFLFAALIGFIVYASEGSETIVSLAQSSRVVDDIQHMENAESFSEVTYEVKYKIDLVEEAEPETKTVIIEASFDGKMDNNGNKIDAEWILYEQADATYSVNEENGNLITEIYDVKTGKEQTFNFHLYLKNIAPDTYFSPTFKIYDKKYQNSDVIDDDNHSKVVSPTDIVVSSTEIELTTKILGGDAYKSEEFNGRYAPFGIMLGFNKNDYDSMKGLYFNPDQTIILSANQIYPNYDDMSDYFALDEVKDYGVYHNNIKGLSKEELTNVFNSGKTLEITKIEADPSLEDEESDSEEENADEESDSEEEETEEEEIQEDEEEPVEDDYLSEIDLSNLYELSISEIKSDGKFYINNIENEEFITLGSYYIVLNSERQEGNEDYIEVILTSYDDNFDEESNGSVSNVLIQEGTQSFNFSLNNEKNDELTIISEDEYLTYGDEVVLSAEYIYGTSWDDNLSELYLKVELKDENGVPLNLINYNEEDSASFYYVSQNYKENIEVVSYKLQSSEEIINESLYMLEDVEELEFLIFKIDNVSPGSKIEIRLKGIVSSKFGSISTIMQAGIVDEDYNYIEEYNSATDSDLLADTVTFNITSFRASTIVYAGNNNKDIIIDDTTNETTFAIFPSVELPALKEQTALLETAYVNTRITVILPDKMKYVANEQYLTPYSYSKSENTLVYIIYNQLINSRIEPIYFDVNYAVDIKNGSHLPVEVIIEAVSTDCVSTEEFYTDGRYEDISPRENRTTIRTITYNSTASVVGSLAFNKNSISRNESFEIISELYNSTEKIISIGLVTLLPYNENMSSSEKGFNGSYNFEIPKNAVCTNVPQNDIQSSEKLLMVQWQDCTELEKDEITAIKVDMEISSNEVVEEIIEIIPEDNAASDVYTVYSYAVIENSMVKNIGKKSVSVFSKKITGVVWEDFDDDGIMDSDENKLPDVILKLYNSSDELISETTSNNKGEYNFADLEKDNYYVIAEFNKDKYSATIRNYSNDISKISSFTQMSSDEENNDTGKAKTEVFEITDDTKTKTNLNLGLSIKKVYKIDLKKYITKVVITNKLGISESKDYGKTSFAKLDVKDINNLKIKVVYLIEVENIGYYPGYIYNIKDYIPNGMTFNENYEENKGWSKLDGNDEYIVNNSLSNTLMNAGQKEVITVAFDITRKDAGSFINYATVGDEDLEIFKINKNDIIKGGN